jgi:SARP family transcriptional regulator, regulator of embCAB operon
VAQFDAGRSTLEVHPTAVSGPDRRSAHVGYADHARLAQFKVLGPLEVVDGERECTPSAPKVRQVLALLLLRANQVVYTDSLIQELWGEKPPPSALTTIQTYIYHLRKLIERERLAADGEQMVVTRSPGYTLRIRDDQVDLARFKQLSRSGREHLEQGRHAEAVTDLQAALAMWSGGPLANVNLGPCLSAYVAELTEHQMTTLHLRIQAEMQQGMHRELLGELRSLAATYPFDEWLHSQLILALERSGRRSDALDIYHRLRTNLDRELGLDPSPQLQELHYQVLTATVPAAGSVDRRPLN